MPQTHPLHYAEVAEIRISNCPTLTNHFSVVFHPGCQKFSLDFCELSKNLKVKKDKEKKSERENGGNMQKKTEGGVC